MILYVPQLSSHAWVSLSGGLTLAYSTCGSLLWNNLLGAQLSKKKESCLSKLQFEKAKRRILSGQLLSYALPTDPITGAWAKERYDWPSLGHHSLWGQQLALLPSRIKPKHNHKRESLWAKKILQYLSILSSLKGPKYTYLNSCNFFIVSLCKLIWMKQKRLLLQLWSGPNFSVSLGGCFYVIT